MTTREPPLQFQVGSVVLRFLQQPWEEQPVIADTRHPALHYEDALANIRDVVPTRVPIDDAPLGSWLLARLWRLIGNAPGLYFGEEGVILQDGGAWVAEFVVEAPSNEPLAVGFVEVWTWFEHAQLTECSERLDPEVFNRDFAATLLADPLAVAECSIEVRDPERTGWQAVYGWNTVCFLGQRTLC